MNDKIKEHKVHLNHLSQKQVLKNPEEIYEIKRMHMDNILNRLNYSANNIQYNYRKPEEINKTGKQPCFKKSK